MNVDRTDYETARALLIQGARTREVVRDRHAAIGKMRHASAAAVHEEAAAQRALADALASQPEGSPETAAVLSARRTLALATAKVLEIEATMSGTLAVLEGLQREVARAEEAFKAAVGRLPELDQVRLSRELVPPFQLRDPSTIAWALATVHLGAPWLSGVVADGDELVVYTSGDVPSGILPVAFGGRAVRVRRSESR